MRPDAQSQVAHAALVVLRRWPVVFGFALAFFLLALVYAAMRPKVYESSAVVIVTPAPFHHSSAIDEAADATQLFSLAELLPPTLPTEVLRELALSPALLAQVIEAAKLEDVTTEQLMKRVAVDLELLRRGGAITASPSLLFRVKAGEPETAANILRAWARLFKERVDALHTFKLEETYELVQDMQSVAEKNLTTAENALETFRKDWNLPLLNQRRTMKEASLTALESQLLQLELDIARHQAAVDTIQHALTEEPEFLTLSQVEPSADVDTNDGDTGEPPGAPVLQDEVLNPVRMHLEEKLSDETRLLHGLTARHEEALAQVKTLENEIDALQTTIAKQTVVENRLARETQSYKQVFELSSVSRGKAELTRVIRASDVFIATDATVSGSPIPGNNTLFVLMATLIGAGFGVAYVLLTDLHLGTARAVS